VVDYLLKAKINPDRLTYKGYGETQPIAPNNTEENMQLNRRTEFKVMSK
jgi:outer membrane protein OmpA-like peptidoglycan-associated protein